MLVWWRYRKGLLANPLLKAHFPHLSLSLGWDPPAACTLCRPFCSGSAGPSRLLPRLSPGDFSKLITLSPLWSLKNLVNYENPVAVSGAEWIMEVVLQMKVKQELQTGLILGGGWLKGLCPPVPLRLPSISTFGLRVSLFLFLLLSHSFLSVNIHACFVSSRHFRHKGKTVKFCL